MARRSTETARDIATARAALYPRRKPQERALNFLPMLARQGNPLLDAMIAEAGRHAARLVVPDEPAARRGLDLGEDRLQGVHHRRHTLMPRSR